MATSGSGSLNDGTRSDSFSDSVWGFGDLIPQAALRWNNGVHNWMTYITGDIPVGLTPPVSRISASGTAPSMPAAATPISIRRPGTNSQACSASPTISGWLRRADTDRRA